MSDETPKTRRLHADNAPETRHNSRDNPALTPPTAISIEIRRQICGSRRLTRITTTFGPQRERLINSLSRRHDVPRPAVRRLLNAIALAALADAQDRAALDLQAQRRAADDGLGELPWADRRAGMDERPRKPRGSRKMKK